MAQSNSRILVHAIFGTKERRPILSPELSAPLHEYMDGVLLQLGNKPIQIGGHRDHIHALFDLGRENSIARTISELKTSSAKALKARVGNTVMEHFPFQDPRWQRLRRTFAVKKTTTE